MNGFQVFAVLKLGHTHTRHALGYSNAREAPPGKGVGSNADHSLWLKTFVYYTGDALNLKYLDRIVVSRSNPNFYSKDGVMYSSDGAYVIYWLPH